MSSSSSSSSSQQFKKRKYSGKADSPHKPYTRPFKRSWSKWGGSAVSLNAPVMFKRCVNRGVVTNVNPAVTETNYYFTLGDVADVADFTALFDQYRIHKVVMKFIPRVNMTAITDIANTTTYITAIDLDDASNLSNTNAVREFTTCLETNTKVVQTRTIFPHIAVAAYGGAFTNFANMRSVWIDSANTGVQHYGLRMMIEAGPAAGDIIFDVRAEYYIQCRNVK